MNIPSSTVSILFGLLLILLGFILWRMQSQPDDFDLRDVICSWDGERQIVSTSKSLLAGAFLASSYYILRNPSDVSFTAYLTAWVANGGIAAWQKTREMPK